jgi:DNA modification methylase
LVTAIAKPSKNGTPVELRVRQGDAFDLLPTLEAESVDLILTSPPYWGLRDYDQGHNWDILEEWKAEGHSHEDIPPYEWFRKHGGLLGLEPLPEWYVAHLVTIFDRAHRVLKPTGSLWLNLGDTYFARWSSIRPKGRHGMAGPARQRRKTPMGRFRQEKQLLLIPARTAIAMQERRWILRNDVIWYKPNVAPRPFKDRLVDTHEHFFHFAKQPKEGRAKYFYDLGEAGTPPHDVVKFNVAPDGNGHSATFREGLIEPRVLSSCPHGGLVLDPFCGTGTTLRVAVRHRRHAIGFDLNAEFVEIARKSACTQSTSMF